MLPHHYSSLLESSFPTILSFNPSPIQTHLDTVSLALDLYPSKLWNILQCKMSLNLSTIHPNTAYSTKYEDTLVARTNARSYLGTKCLDPLW